MWDVGKGAGSRGQRADSTEVFLSSGTRFHRNPGRPVGAFSWEGIVNSIISNKPFHRAVTKKRALAAIVAATLPVTAASNAALAQQAAAAPAAVSEEIVVTGSRIVRDGYEAPTPVSVINADQIQTSAAENMAQYIIALPSLSGSTTPQTTQNSVSGGGAGVSGLNLRGMGTARTLVLLNGQRLVGSLITGVVDVGTLPQQLVSRVDVVTGGASAAYGSDALSGVVNFVIDNEFTGVKGEISGGQTTYKDGRNWKVAVSAGTPFAGGRGHFLISTELSEDKGQPGFGHEKRPYMLDGWQIMNNPNYTATNGQPQLLYLSQVGPGNAYEGGLIVSGPAKGIAFGPGGAQFRWQYGDLVSGNQMRGGHWYLTPRTRSYSLSPPQDRKNIYTRTSYDVTDDLNVHLEVSWAYASNYALNSPQYALGNMTIRATNPYIPADVRAMLGTVTQFNMGHYFSDLPENDSYMQRRRFRVAGGFDGKFDAGGTEWSYDGYFSDAWGLIDNRVPETTSLLALSMALDSVAGPDGRPICNPANVGFTTGVAGRNLVFNPSQCVPFNPFGIGVNNDAAVQWLRGSPYMHFHIHQQVAAVNFSGEPFESWAGPVSLAMGAEYRKESSDGLSDGLSQNRAWFIGNYNPTVGSYNILEGYVETVVPLASNTDFADALDLNAGVRAADYSSSGLEWTWKVGMTYAPTSDIRFRVTRSRDVRAPTLQDLYAPGTSNTSSIIDRFNNNVNAQYQGRAIGNPNLEPERADTLGVGVVLQPTFLPGFGASVDYYRINLKDGIGGINAQQTVDICFDTQDPVLCNRIVRIGPPPPGGTVSAIDHIITAPYNAGIQKARGVDFEASYVLPVDRIVTDLVPGDLTLRFLATKYIMNESVSGLPGGIPNDNVGSSALPEWRWQARFGYRSESWNGEVALRGMSDGVLNTSRIECTTGCPTSTTNNQTINYNRYDAKTYVDFSASYRLNHDDRAGNEEIFFNVRNLMNVDPPPIPPGPGGVPDAVNSVSAAVHDTMGRTYRIGLRFRM